jgi:hypothetical protein
MAVIYTPAAGINQPRTYRTRAFDYDDFMSGSVASQVIGKLGWQFVNGTVAAQASEANHPGIIRRSTGASSGTSATMFLGPGTTFTAQLSSSNFDMTWVFRLNTNDTTTALDIGLGVSSQANLITLHKAAADTNFFFRTRTGGSEEKTDTGIEIDEDWHTARIVRVGTSCYLWLDYVLVATNTEHLPTAAISPIVMIVNSEAAEKTVDIDYFEGTVEVNR